MQKILKNKKKQRIKFIAISSIICLVALAFIISNFRSNIVFFYSPSELVAAPIKAGQTIRIGGMVKKGSVENDSQKLRFVLTDFEAEIAVKYSGIRPNLFREGQGMVAKGVLSTEGKVFEAAELLAKHDENYMPPEVKKALKKKHEDWLM